ncbi:MAG TPA: ABC transporter permease [Myxococcota bacterium]|nr:ABC transporter permease [Myxococcota bacterium]
MRLLVMAWRNVWRNSRRSTITIAAMALAVWAELIYSGLVTGMVADMAGDVTDYDLGDLQVFSKGWQDRPSLHETVDAEAILPALDAAGYAATARLQAGGLAAAGELSAGVAFIGLDPARDAKVLRIGEAVGEGAWLDPSDPRGVVIGRGLARTLALQPGGELVVLSQAADGSMANDLFHVRGVLMSVASGTDRGTILMTDGMFRELMVFPRGAHRIVLRARPGEGLDAAAAAVKGLAPGAEVKTWKAINPLIAQMLDAVQVQVAVIYFILYIAVAILVLNAMLMAIFERIREFGVLKAIGYGPGQVFTLMMAEGLLQAVVAVAVGAAFAAPVMAWLAVYGVDVGALGGVSMVGMTMPAVWHGVYTWETVRVPVFMLFGIVSLAVLYPALKAAWIRPVEAMHHS